MFAHELSKHGAKQMVSFVKDFIFDQFIYLYYYYYYYHYYYFVILCILEVLLLLLFFCSHLYFGSIYHPLLVLRSHINK